MEDTLIDFGISASATPELKGGGGDMLIDFSVPAPKLSTQRIEALKAQPIPKDKLLDFTGFWGNVKQSLIPEPTQKELAAIPGGYKPMVKPEALTISAAPPQTLWQKINPFKRTGEEAFTEARRGKIQALEQADGAKKSAVGLSPSQTVEHLTSAGMVAALPYILPAVGIAGLAKGVATFAGVAELENAIISTITKSQYQLFGGKGLQDIAPEDESEFVKVVSDVADFIIQAGIAGKVAGVFDKAKFARRVIKEVRAEKELGVSKNVIGKGKVIGEQPKPAEQIVSEKGKPISSQYENLEIPPEPVKVAPEPIKTEPVVSTPQPDKIDALIDQYNSTGRVAFRYPRKRTISINGRTMPEKEAVAKMTEVVSSTQPKTEPVVSTPQPAYLYHNSSQRNFDTIQQEGISRKYAGEYPHGIKEIPDSKPRIYLSEDPKRALEFGGMVNSKYPETRSLLMRVKKSALGGDTYKTNLSGGETWYFGEGIKPDNIEYLDGGVWKPLTNKVSQPIKPEGTPANLDSVISANAENVSKNIHLQKQAGFVSIGKEKTPEVSHPEKVRKILDVTRTPANVVQSVGREVGKIREGIRKTFVFKENVIGHPEYRNDVRKFIDSPIDARNKSERAIFGIIGDLNRAEYGKFRRIVALADLVETASDGKAIPRGVTLPQVKASLDAEMKVASPAVTNAVNKHFELMKLVGKDLVGRGKLGEEQVRANYYPHKVLDYEPEWGDWVGFGQKIKKPYRPYTRERVGSVRDIDMDYVRVVDNHLSKVFLDNSVDDFIAAQMAKNDIMPKLTPQQRVVFGEKGRPQPGRLYKIDGKQYKAFQAEPGNAIYPASTINERLFNMAVENNMTAAEFSQLKGVRGGKAIGEAGVIGAPHKVYLLPEAIADDLLRFKTPAGDLGLLYPLINATAMWKRVTLDFAGLPFQIGNMFGDAINLYKTDPAAFTKVPEAVKMILRNPKKLTQAERDMLGLAAEHRVTTTFFLQEAGITPEGKLLKRFDDPLHKYNPLVWLADMAENLSMKREGILRLSKFMKDMERIQLGENVRAGEIDIKGLPQIEAAGKVSREALVDYGNTTGAYKRFVRGLLAPFMTFYDYNARNWVRYVSKNPANAAVKFGIPLAAMWSWNNTGERKQTEENLPDWMQVIPHINTGWIGKDGKQIVIALQTPIDMAGSWFGLDKIPEKITSVRAGDMTAEEAAKKQVKDMVVAPAIAAGALLNPLIQGIYAITKNESRFGYPIVPEKAKGTPEEAKLKAQYMAQNLLAPYGQFMKASRMIEPGDMFTKWLLGGAFDLKRALGIREVDIQKGKQERVEKKEVLLESRLKTGLLYLEKGFEDYAINQDRTQLDKAVKWMADHQVSPTETQIGNRILNWGMIERIVKGKIRKSNPDSPEYKEYKDMLKYINDNRQVLMFKETPTAIRGQLLGEIGRVYK